MTGRPGARRPPNGPPGWGCSRSTSPSWPWRLGWLLTLPLVCLGGANWPRLAPLLPPIGLALSAGLYVLARRFGAPEAPLAPTVLIYLLLGWSALALLRPVTALRAQLALERAQARRDAQTLQGMTQLAELSARTDLDLHRAAALAAHPLARALDVRALSLYTSRPGQPARLEELSLPGDPPGIHPRDLEGRAALIQAHHDPRPTFVNASSSDRPGGTPGEAAAWAIMPLNQTDQDGCSLLVVGSADLIRWGVQERTLLETAARAITLAADRRHELQRLDTLAHQDALTGCLNRHAFGRTMAQLDHAPWRGYAIALLDLNGFKALNDREGHARGDEILATFAGALRETFFERASLFRLGGDEFALVLRDVPAVDLSVLAGKIGAATGASAVLRSARVSVSVGLAHAAQAPHAEGVLALADERMYAAKGRRRHAPGPPGARDRPHGAS